MINSNNNDDLSSTISPDKFEIIDANSNIIQGFSTNPDTIKSIQKEKYNLLSIKKRCQI